SDSTNIMLENAEAGLRQLLEGNQDISTGLREVNNGRAEGFKQIETGFRSLFTSINGITDATAQFRNETEYYFSQLTLFPQQLEKDLGSRAALGVPERMAAPLWQSSERIEQCWRAVQS